jgi:hypothetical protein
MAEQMPRLAPSTRPETALGAAKHHLVATGALPDINAASVKDLPVLPVEQVLEKAQQVLKDLETDKLAGAPVMFFYPSANAHDAGLAEVLAGFPRGRATAHAIAHFGELLDLWAPVASRIASPRRATPYRRQG